MLCFYFHSVKSILKFFLVISSLTLGLFRSGLFDFHIFGVVPDFFECMYFGALLDAYAFIIVIVKEEIHNSMITVGNFKTLLSKTDKTIRKI